MLPLSCSIAGEERVKWPSYGKSKGKSIRRSRHPTGRPTRSRKTRIYRPWQCERPFYIPIAEAEMRETGGTVP